MELLPDDPDAYLATMERRLSALEGAARGATLNQVRGFDITHLGGGTGSEVWTAQGLAATVQVPLSGQILVECQTTVGVFLTAANELELHMGALYSGANTRTDPYDPNAVWAGGVPFSWLAIDPGATFDAYLMFNNKELITGLTPGETVFDVGLWGRTDAGYVIPPCYFTSVLVTPQ